MRFPLGHTIRIGAEVTDYEDAYITPTSIEVTIFKGSTTVLAYTAMIPIVQGKYYYLWQSTTSLAAGKYESKVKVFSNGYYSYEHDERAFYLY